jgi:ATP-binding cassette subfamily B protein
MTNKWALARGRTDKREPGLGWREQMRVIGRVLPLLWPKGETGLKIRVVTSFALILVGKVVNVILPIVYKWVVDALSTGPRAAIIVPVALITGYGLVRIAAAATTEIRDLVFANVQERALRLVSVGVLKHLLDMSLRFHLDRQTGGLSRAIERGTEAIESLICCSTSRRSS